MKVVILCGGQGSRLEDLTSNTPKPMLIIGDRPILYHIMKGYSSWGYNEFILCVGYKSEVIKDYFLNYDHHSYDFTLRLHNPDVIYENRSADDNFLITFCDSGINTTTGGRVHSAMKYVHDDQFMITYGDGLSNITIPALMQAHKKHRTFATVTGVHPPSRFGELGLKGDSITTFEEKPQTTLGLINGGFMLFEKDVLNYIDPTQTLEAGLGNLADAKEMGIYKHEDFWMCIDTKRELEQANYLWNTNQAPWKIWQ